MPGPDPESPPFHPRPRRPSPGLVVITAASVAAFFGLAALGWGSWGGLTANRIRAAGLGVIGLAAAASLFSGIHLGGCTGPGARGQWRLVPLALISLGLAWFPPWADRRGIGAVGGEWVRLAGVVLLAVGAYFRVAPMFLLGERFTWPLAEQPPHALLTTGPYRLVRHPSYAGALVGAFGWALLFRSAPAFGLIALLFPFFVPVIAAEEATLVDEFGDAYRDYRRRTWRLIPFVY